MEPFTIHYLFDHSLGDEFISDLVKRCIKAGCTTTQNGRTDVCTYSSESKTVMGPDQQAQLETALSQLDTDSYGEIFLWYDSLRIGIRKNIEYPIVPDVPRIGLSIESGGFKLSEDDERLREKRALLDSYIDLAAIVAEHTNPVYGYGEIDTYQAHPHQPEIDAVRRGEVSHLFWFNLFAETMIERLGYYVLTDAQDNARAWRVKELETGSIVLVASDSFNRPTEGWRGNREQLAEHLGIPT